MMLDANALDIIAYLKTASGKYFSLSEISRRAGGRKRYEECPGWARNLMVPLVEAGLIEVNARGHYRVPPHTKPATAPKPAVMPPPQKNAKAKVIGDDYFPEPAQPRIVGGDYFPHLD